MRSNQLTGFSDGPVSKAYRVAASKKVTFGIPHMEWNDESEKFEKCPPKPPPVIKVETSLMTNAHRNFSINCKEVQSTTMNAIADTGCQTTTCGMKEL